MTSPVQTPIEARVAHITGTVLGIGFAIAGFVASHKGATIPATGLTVGGLIAGASQWRYVKVVEGLLAELADWEAKNGPAVSALQALIPPGFRGRWESLETTADAAYTIANEAKQVAAAKATVDINAVSNEVIKSLDTTAIAQKVVQSLASSAVVPVPPAAPVEPVAAPVAPVEAPPLVPDVMPT